RRLRPAGGRVPNPRELLAALAGGEDASRQQRAVGAESRAIHDQSPDESGIVPPGLPGAAVERGAQRPAAGDLDESAVVVAVRSGAADEDRLAVRAVRDDGKRRRGLWGTRVRPGVG